MGVPQGLVLGSLLFCLYVMDIRELLDSAGVAHISYADDLQIYIDVPLDGLHVDVAALEQAALAVSDWAAGASLRLNAGKTKAILFGSRGNLKTLKERGLPDVRLGDGVSVPFSDVVTGLGVVLDSNLTWRPHIDGVTKRLNGALYSLRFFRHYTTGALRARLASALLFPLLDYCSVVCIDASLEQRSRLQRLQNACVRYVVGARLDEHITPHRRALGWLKVDTRRDYFMSVLLHKVLRMNVPAYLVDYFNTRKSRRPVRGDAGELVVPFVRTEAARRSFRVYGANFWNGLPASVRLLPSLSRFKRAVREHLFALD